MVSRLIIGAVALSLSLGLTSFSPEGRTLPSVELKGVSGKKVNISTLTNEGKPMIVIAWEVTCLPAIAQFNNIARVYKSWQEETGVRLVAVSTDDNRSSPRVFPLVKTKGWDFEVFLDPNQEFKRAMNIPLCPYAYVLSGKGEVVWQKAGYSPGDETIMYEVVKKVAAGQPISE